MSGRGDPWVLVFAHGRQISWYAAIAREVRKHVAAEWILWVEGEQNRRRGQAQEVYSRVVDLLRDAPRRDEANETTYREDLRYLADTLRDGEGFRYRELIDIDRHVRRHRWTDPEVAAYARHLVEAMRGELAARPDPPMLAFGENNSLAYRVAHRLLEGVPYFHFLPARHWNERFVWSHDQKFEWTRCREIYEDFRREGVPEEVYEAAAAKLESFRREEESYEYRGRVRGSPTRRLSVIVAGFRESLRELRSRESGVNPREGSAWVKSPFYRTCDLLRIHLRRGWYEKVLCGGGMESPRCAVYFMHFEPEHLLDTLTVGKRGQVELIRTISQSLPADTKLLVKEHRRMLGRRRIEYYRDLAALANVQLISAQTPTNELIRRAEIVFTPAGTAALEASFLNTPSVVFGDIFFSGFEGVSFVPDTRELTRVVKERLRSGDDDSKDEPGIRALAAMREASVAGKAGSAFADEEICEEENARLLAVPIVETMKLLETEITLWGVEPDRLPRGISL